MSETDLAFLLACVAAYVLGVGAGAVAVGVWAKRKLKRRCRHWGNVYIASYTRAADGRVSVGTGHLPDGSSPFRVCAKCLRPYTELRAGEVTDGWDLLWVATGTASGGDAA